MSTRKQTILFDLDGTLTDPLPGVASSLRYALDTLGIPYAADETFAWCIGPPVQESMLALTKDQKQSEALLPLYRDRYGKQGLFENTPYPGISTLLTSLRDEGFQLLVATSKLTPFAERVLQHFELHTPFESIQGSEQDGSITTKEDVIRALLTDYALDPTHCIMIGDRKHDVIGAQTHGIRSIGVLWGYGSKEELSDAGADNLCTEVAHLPAAIQAVFSKT